MNPKATRLRLELCARWPGAIRKLIKRHEANLLKFVTRPTVERVTITRQPYEEFRHLNFEVSNYLNRQGKLMPYAEMTRDGFMFLAMGFTGKEAAKHTTPQNRK